MCIYECVCVYACGRRNICIWVCVCERERERERECVRVCVFVCPLHTHIQTNTYELSSCFRTYSWVCVCVCLYWDVAKVGPAKYALIVVSRYWKKRKYKSKFSFVFLILFLFFFEMERNVVVGWGIYKMKRRGE